jgi:hypothetical protein
MSEILQVDCTTGKLTRRPLTQAEIDRAKVVTDGQAQIEAILASKASERSVALAQIQAKALTDPVTAALLKLITG